MCFLGEQCGSTLSCPLLPLENLWGLGAALGVLPGEHSEHVCWPLGDGVWPGRLVKEKTTIQGVKALPQPCPQAP